MLESMNGRGFTMIEMLVVVVLIAVLLGLVSPPFMAYMDKRRVDGVAAELATDLQLARSEAVSRRQPVRITFATNCYVVHVAGAAANCTSTGASIVKTVQLAAGGPVSLAAASSMTYVEFNPQLADASWNGTNAATATVDIADSAGKSPLRINVLALGRSQVCSPGGKNKGFASC